ncbi:MAG: flagellar biosynthesis protein FliQ [Spirochaetes bacterium]|nr:flagellar biosynthesis protein FliQ [Spirochaetota bacterium]
MDEVLLQEILVQSMKLAIMIAGPILGSGMIVGLFIAILQATTSIQEQTLTFVPKIFAIALAIVIFGPWIVTNMTDFAQMIFELIPLMGQPG